MRGRLCYLLLHTEGILIPFTDAIMIPAILIYGGIIATMACLATNRHFTLEIGATSRTTDLVGSIFSWLQTPHYL